MSRGGRDEYKRKMRNFSDVLPSPDSTQVAMQKSRAPPSLQDLVLAYETWDKIPWEAWQAFDVEMIEWKAKVRYGELHVLDRS